MLRRFAEEKLEAAEKELTEADFEGIDELAAEMHEAEEELQHHRTSIKEMICFATPPRICLDGMQVLY
jgi:hypothetical protein